MILQHFSYADFKTSFYKRVKDIAPFEIGGTNFIKVIMENLVVRYGIKGKIRSYILYPFPALYLYAKKITLFRKKKTISKYNEFIENYKGKEFDFILVDGGRTILNEKGEKISFYYHNIRNYLRENNIKYLQYFESHTSTVYEDDFDDSSFREVIRTQNITVFDKTLLADLKQLYKNVKKSGYFSKEEISHIKGGLTVFFETAKLWDFYIKKFKPKKIFLLGHYHREGIIFACRKNKVEVIELQHGLIAEEDIFYVFPVLFKKIKDKSLFADKIYTYGSHWNDILKKGHEYSEEQIKTIGYYLYEDKMGSVKEEELLQRFTKNNKTILITTQPALHTDFCDYLRTWLANNPENFCFIIKLHPADIETWYEEFKSHPNILITRIRLEVLFKFSISHVTSYSTTIYDAFRYGIESYSVNFPSSSDYVKKITDEGFSILLQTNQYPNLTVTNKNKKAISFERFFRKPDLTLLLN